MSARTIFSWLLVVAALAAAAGALQRALAVPLGTTFTHQGRLTDGGLPANGAYDLQFKLFDAANSSTQVGGTVTKDDVSVANGLFTVQLDFGGVFDGSARWLELGVRPGSSTGGFQMLSPRQALNAAPYALFSAAPWATNGNDISYTLGEVGIGTTSPSASLSVVRSGASEPSASGLPTGLKVGTPSGTLPFALRQDAPENATPSLALFETASGNLGYLGADTNTFVVGAVANKQLALRANGSTGGLVIDSSGRVGIGTGTPDSLSKLTVKSATAGTGNYAISAFNSDGTALFLVNDVGSVYVGTFSFDPPSTVHVCHSEGGGTLVECSSAAEYVPTIDDGRGYPEAGDLVSIAPAFANPYSDPHGPFVVQKAATPCDTNLLGFITHPESGADGKKLNDHYLPLAIYGYFPAKITLEGGPIKRGDPITSSSKPGYGMKATGACKIIGYALDDATHEGTIQVFAHHGENAAPEVAALRTQVQELRQANVALAARLETLEEPNGTLEARLTALEQALHKQSPAGHASRFKAASQTRSSKQGGEIDDLKERLAALEQAVQNPYTRNSR